MPLFKSSSAYVIYILFSKVRNIELRNLVFSIEVYFSLSKPVDMSTFLEEFISEYINLTESGSIIYDGKCIPVEIIEFCCDAPAKSDIHGTKYYGGFLFMHQV